MARIAPIVNEPFWDDRQRVWDSEKKDWNEESVERMRDNHWNTVLNSVKNGKHFVSRWGSALGFESSQLTDKFSKIIVDEVENEEIDFSDVELEEDFDWKNLSIDLIDSNGNKVTILEDEIEDDY